MKRLLHTLLFAFLVLFTILVYLHTDTSITEDLGRHLILGKIILETKSVPKINLFSYTYPDYPFINHHWGSEIIFYLVYSVLSINGLIILKTLIFSSAFLLPVFYSLKKIRNPLYVITTGILSLEILRDRTWIRPEIFGYLLFSIFLVIVFKEKEKAGKGIWLLPLCIVFWVNLHISFIFGIVIFTLFIADRLIVKKMRREYVVILFLMLIVSLFNPNTWYGALYPLRIFQNYGYTIVENQSVFYLENYAHRFLYGYFKTGLILSILFSIPLIIKKKFFETGIILLTGFLSLFAVRNFPLFALSIIYPLAYAMETIIDWIKTVFARLFQGKRIIISFGCYLLLTAVLMNEVSVLITNTYYTPYYPVIRTGLGQVSGGKGAVDFFLFRHLSGPVFNNFDIGSYLIYRLYPKERVFVDGRPEAYPSDFFIREYIPMQENPGVWKKMLEKWKFKTILFSRTDLTPWGQQFLRRIVKDGEWKLVYSDDYAVILTRKESV